MSEIVEHNLPCLNPDCGSSDARQMYDTGTSFCFSCTTFFPPEGEEVKRVAADPSSFFKKKQISLEEVKTYPIRGFDARKISKAVCEFFEVRVTYGENGEIDAHYYPYDEGTAYKIRKLPKDFTWINKSDALFGKEKFAPGGRRVIICEGEIDALSVAEACYQKYKKVYPVVALSSSSMAKKSLLAEREWLRSFGEVIWAGDEDEAGYKAREEAIKIIGLDKIKLVKFPKNDANDVLIQLGSSELNARIWDAAPYVPAGILGKVELKKQMHELELEPSIPYPECLKGIQTKLKGIRLGQIALYISGTGCFGVDTEILMYDGTIKKVQNVKIGDIVMGDDNTPRNVLKLYRGQENLNLITLRDDTSFICNDSHVLSLVNNDNEGRWGLHQDQIVDVVLVNYLNWSDKRKHLSKMVKSSFLEFEQPAIEAMLHPYILGVWLGDGHTNAAVISCQDSDVATIEKLRALGLVIYRAETKFGWNSPGYLRTALQEISVFGNKHIPERYLIANIEDRLELLAGLLDTDGNYDYSKNMYEFSQKSKVFIDQVNRLACSLGFATSMNIQKNNQFGNCWRLWISGEGLEQIPCALPRKQARRREQIKNPHRYSFTVESLGVGDYFGFEVDGNHRFVLGNFIITHNSGKSTVIREVILHLRKIISPEEKIGIISLEESPGETARSMASMYLERNLANEEISMEDLDRGFDEVFDSDQLIVLDHQGSIKDESIVEQMEYMALMGCKYLFIDHITILVSEGASDLVGNAAIDKIMNDLLRIAKKHRIHIGLVSHLRKTIAGGKSFEEGKLPSLDDIKGSGSIKQVSLDIIAFARDMSAEDDATRNHIIMSVLKCRATGLTGPVQGAQYNFATGRISARDDTMTEFIEVF